MRTQNQKIFFFVFYGSLALALTLLILCAGNKILPAMVIAMLVLFFFSLLLLEKNEKMRKKYEEEKNIIEWLNGPEFLRVMEGQSTQMIPEGIRTAVQRGREVAAHGNLSESERVRLEFSALQSQINPHFLYNTLDVIRGQAMEVGAEDIAAMTENLSKYYRYTISNQADLVTVEDEIRNAEEYFFIQRFRFEDRFTLEVKGADEYIRRGYLPKLIFQPIIENALYHGLEKKRGKGTVVISFERTEENVTAWICDDGIGMTQEKVESCNRNLQEALSSMPSINQKHGIALINVNRRLRLLFGEPYGIRLFSLVGMGTQVEVRFPYVDDELKQRYS